MPRPNDEETTLGLGALAVKVSNELNNPLAAVMSAHHYLRTRLESGGGDARDPRVPQFFDLVDRELQVMARIVDDLRVFGAPLHIRPSTFALRALVDDAAKEVRRPSAISFVNGVDESLFPVHLDREACLRALSHLIRNAVEAYGLDPGEVVVTGEVTGSEVVVTVRDEATGILPDVVPRIREPLFGTKVKGTGLGLAIAEAMARGQGGELTCASEVGRGSTFTLRFTQQLATRAPDPATP